MKANSKNLGLVTKKFNDFFLVDLKNQENFGNNKRFLCKVRKSINFKDQLIYVGDEVVIDNNYLDKYDKFVREYITANISLNKMINQKITLSARLFLFHLYFL